MKIAGDINAKVELTEVDRGGRAVILKIEGGREYRERLMNLGIIPGVFVRIIRGANRNPMLLAVMNRQVVLGYDIAKKVKVEQLSPVNSKSG